MCIRCEMNQRINFKISVFFFNPCQEDAGVVLPTANTSGYQIHHSYMSVCVGYITCTVNKDLLNSRKVVGHIMK